MTRAATRPGIFEGPAGIPLGPRSRSANPDRRPDSHRSDKLGSFPERSNREQEPIKARIVVFEGGRIYRSGPERKAEEESCKPGQGNCDGPLAHSTPSS